MARKPNKKARQNINRRLTLVKDDQKPDTYRAPDPADDEDEQDGAEAARNRDDELLDNKKLVEKIRDTAVEVAKGFENQWQRDNDAVDYWDIYDQVIGGKQSYAGNHTVFLPIVRQAIEARVTRFVNQIFPRSSRNVDCITSDEKPYDIMALLEHYIRKARLRTQIIPALMRNGDVEGQYNLYVGWESSSRHVVVKTPAMLDIEGEQVEDPGGEDDVEEIETTHMQPTVEVLADCDVLVLPHNSNSVGGALEKGGCVAIIRRWSKSRLEQAIDEEEIDEKEGEALLKEFGTNSEAPNQQNVGKKHISAAGITTGEGGKQLVFYEIWKKLKVDGKRRLVRAYYAGGNGERLMSLRRNPYWCDKCPLLSAPQKKIGNAFKGVSEVKAVADLQYSANDMINEGLDSADYALMPIIMTDPAKNPRVGSMVLNLAAIWETHPNDTKFAQFPSLWKDALTIVSGLKNEIFQVLSVSPAMLPQSSGGKVKRNQAEIAMEQQIDIMSTADVCTNLEDEVLTPLLRWFVDLDYQYRDQDLTVRQYGNMGRRAGMEEIKPLQNTRRFEFRWFGVESARNAQMQQIQVSAINVVKGIPPQMYEGHKLRLAPFISQLLENAFGPRMTPELWESIKDKLSMAPEMENEFLMEGLTLPVHELDDDQQHMKEHLKALVSGDTTGSVREHMLMHRQQMNMKLQAQAESISQMSQGAPGGPGGGGPGVAGTPRQGAQPMPPRGGQQPPGAIHADRLVDGAPRR
ncbi:MAG: hypothetical protein KGL35_24955 [Bradyrhizobium sp.]|nr:hypothetical protein [Bradyrhizobium sp.]